jgi:hypothetical protein
MPPSQAWTRPRRLRIAGLALVLLAPLVALTAQAPARGSTLPTGFTDLVVLGGPDNPVLSNPTVVQFAADGRIFVGQKNGVIKVFQSLTDTSPHTFADLSTKVHDY